MNYRYVKSVEERKEGETCINLIDGFLAPSWQARNLLMYSPTSKYIDKDKAFTLYKKELYNIWIKESNDEKINNVKYTLSAISSGEKDFCIANVSGNPNIFSDAFLDFLKWLKIS